MIEEIKLYEQDEGLGKEQVLTELNAVKDNIDNLQEFPICVLSHMYDKKRSTFLVQLLDEGINRECVIFTYDDQKDLYEQFESVENVTVHYIPSDVKEYLSLSGKRQYILDWAKALNYSDIFCIEDDCSKFYLPIGGIGGTGNFRNRKFQMTLNLTFTLWESLIKRHELTYSGPVNNMEFTFRDLQEHPFIKENAQVVQSIHVSINNIVENNISYDHNAGWDDYDMIIQQCVKSKGTQGIIFSYCTPSLKSGVSTMSADNDALAKRCEKNSLALINKWGLSLVREDTKKGLYNAKVNWYTIRSCYKNNVDVSEVVGLSNQGAKDYIKNKLTGEMDEW